MKGSLEVQSAIIYPASEERLAQELLQDFQLGSSEKAFIRMGKKPKSNQIHKQTLELM